MSLLEIISKLCEVTEILSEIVKKQQIVIEQSKIEETIKRELQQNIKEADEKTNTLEYGMRKYCDVDDKFPYGKPQTDEVARGSGTESMAVRD